MLGSFLGPAAGLIVALMGQISGLVTALGWSTLVLHQTADRGEYEVLILRQHHREEHAPGGRSGPPAGQPLTKWPGLFSPALRSGGPLPRLLRCSVRHPTIGLFPTAFEVIMRSGRHFVEWQGERYTVEPFQSLPRVTSRSPVWAVSRRAEFIGTLPYRPQETTKEFEVRCIAWLSNLYGR